MGKFLESEKPKQAAFKLLSPSITADAREAGLYKTKCRPYCLLHKPAMDAVPDPAPRFANASHLAIFMRISGGMRVATLHLMVGLPCSGKTTLAQKLEREHSALRLTPDEWHVCLFGQDAEEPEHNARHNLIESLLWKIASRALVLGTSVILDFGFWAREEREDFRLRAEQLGASSEVHFLDVPEEELMRRLAERNAQDSQESFHIPEEAMKPWIAFFQRPTPDELERRE